MTRLPCGLALRLIEAMQERPPCSTRFPPRPSLQWGATGRFRLAHGEADCILPILDLGNLQPFRLRSVLDAGCRDKVADDNHAHRVLGSFFPLIISCSRPWF